MCMEKTINLCGWSCREVRLMYSRRMPVSSSHPTFAHAGLSLFPASPSRILSFPDCLSIDSLSEGFLGFSFPPTPSSVFLLLLQLLFFIVIDYPFFKHFLSPFFQLLGVEGRRKEWMMFHFFPSSRHCLHENERIRMWFILTVDA